MEIKSVKIQGNGYLLNGYMSVPKANGNREYELIKEWLAQGNVPEPEFTEAELAQQVINAKVQEAKAYLASTDYIVTKIAEAQALGKDTTLLLSKYAVELQQRKEAREFIGANS